MPDDLGAHEFVPQAAVGCARCGVRPDHPIHEVGPKPMTVIADRSATIVELQQQLAVAQGQAREYRAEVMRLEKLLEERDEAPPSLVDRVVAAWDALLRAEAMCSMTYRVAPGHVLEAAIAIAVAQDALVRGATITPIIDLHSL